MKYTIAWEVSNKIEIEAESEEQAIEKVHNSEYDEREVNSEIVMSPEVIS